MRKTRLVWDILRIKCLPRKKKFFFKGKKRIEYRLMECKKQMHSNKCKETRIYCERAFKCRFVGS